MTAQHRTPASIAWPIGAFAAALMSGCPAFVDDPYRVIAEDGGTEAGGSTTDASDAGTGGSLAPDAGSGGNSGTGSGGESGSGGTGGDAGTVNCQPNCDCEAFGGSTYMFCMETVTWTAADAACQVAGGRLATVPDAETDNWLLMNATERGFTATWLCGNDLGVEGHWRWCEEEPFYFAGMPLPPGSYENWELSQPNNAGFGEHCMVYGTVGWRDLTCGTPASYICALPE